MVNYTAQITGLTQYNGDEVSFSITCMYKHPRVQYILSSLSEWSCSKECCTISGGQ